MLIFVHSLNTRRAMQGMSVSGSGGLASVSPAVEASGEMKEYADEASHQRNATLVGLGKVDGRLEPNYQGLPARFEIPEGERLGFFGQEMLPTDREQSVRVLLVSSTVVWFLGIALVALALAMIWRSRAMLSAGLGERLAAQVVEAEVPAAS